MVRGNVRRIRYLDLLLDYLKKRPRMQSLYNVEWEEKLITNGIWIEDG
jgi:hypothetical protein